MTDPAAEPPPRRTAPPLRTAADEDLGGDPVCWLDRVCPECGAFLPDGPDLGCPRCGA